MERQGKKKEKKEKENLLVDSFGEFSPNNSKIGIFLHNLSFDINIKLYWLQFEKRKRKEKEPL